MIHIDLPKNATNGWLRNLLAELSLKIKNDENELKNYTISMAADISAYVIEADCDTTDHGKYHLMLKINPSN